ncbi:hypothetical protein BYT27DRAFT_6794916 [Phlegmacium glaucopus]|nr:hypothetical protein BYT27DRAFT_6794916 [Phlegmacium glaucopus]
MRDKRTNAITSNTFTAISTQIKILERAADRPSPYKSLMLKGPTFLPQSPSKKKRSNECRQCIPPSGRNRIQCRRCQLFKYQNESGKLSTYA